MSNRVYEILFIADPNLGEPEVDTLTAQVQGFVEKDGGKVQKVEKWGKKRLAYERQAPPRGLLRAARRPRAPGPWSRKSSASMKVTDGVIRYLTVRVDEELRKAERRKARRALADEKRKRPPGRHGARQSEGVQP